MRHKAFLLFGLLSTVTGFESPKTCMIPFLVAAVVVPVSEGVALIKANLSTS